LDNLTLKEMLPIKADFYAETTTGSAPIAIQFYDLSKDATAWRWDFGDGATSTEKDPIHTYTKGGVFTVSLTASNSGSTDTLTQHDLVTIIGTNSVASVDFDKYSVYSTNKKIYIDGVTKNVELIDISGRLIQSEKVVGKFISDTMNSGLYIIRVDGFTTKVTVK